MADTARATDTSLGLSMVFGLVALLAALATLATSYASIFGDNHRMQVLSGVALAVSLLAAGLAVAAVHTFQD